jgi:hypothetical protein
MPKRLNDYDLMNKAGDEAWRMLNRLIEAKNRGLDLKPLLTVVKKQIAILEGKPQTVPPGDHKRTLKLVSG